MPAYTFYGSDGEITHTIDCPAHDLHLNVQPGEQYIEGDYNAAQHTIVNGRAVARPVPRDALTEIKRMQHSA